MSELKKLKKSLGDDATYLELIAELKKSNNYSREIFDEIADEMEDILSPAEMWNILRCAFSMDEFVENLEYIARETDI